LSGGLTAVGLHLTAVGLLLTALGLLLTFDGRGPSFDGQAAAFFRRARLAPFGGVAVTTSRAASFWPLFEVLATV